MLLFSLNLPKQFLSLSVVKVRSERNSSALLPGQSESQRPARGSQNHSYSKVRAVLLITLKTLADPNGLQFCLF